MDVGVLLSYQRYPNRQSRADLVIPLNVISATHCNDGDVVILNDAPPELAVTIVRGLRLYCADEQADRDFVRTAQLRYADIRPFLERTRRLKLQAFKR